MRGCRRARAWILEAAEGELELGQRFQLEEHLNRCAACRAEQAASLVLGEALTTRPEPPVDRLDLDAVVARIDAEIDRRAASGEADRELSGPALASPDPAPGDRRPARRRRPVLTVALAAAAALLAVVLLWDPPSDEPGRGPESEVASLPEAEAPAIDLSVPAEGDAIEPERLDLARRRVAEGLLASFGPAAGAEPGTVDLGPCLAAFEEETRDLARNWPVRTLVERLLLSPNVDEARAAACYLGARGSGLSAGPLRDTLVRPDIAPYALAGLTLLGEEGLAGMIAALDHPSLRDAARAGIVAVEGERSARAVEEALMRAGRGRFAIAPTEAGRRGALLEALPALRPPAVASVLRLEERGALTDGEALAALERMPGAGAELARLLADEPQAVEPAFTLRALARLAPAEALPWVEERAVERRLRDQALACLADYGTPEALASLVEMRDVERVSSELLVEAASTLLDAAPESAVDLARRHVRAGDDASALLGLLLECSRPGTGAALVELILAPGLTSDERQWAALAIGELGGSADAERLAVLLPELGPQSHLLAAALLFSIDRLAGTDVVLRAVRPLEAFDRGDEDAVLALLEEASREGVRVTLIYRIARRLEESFDPKRESQRSS